MAFLFELLILVKGCVICIIVENTLCSDFTVTVINVHILFTVFFFTNMMLNKSVAPVQVYHLSGGGPVCCYKSKNLQKKYNLFDNLLNFLIWKVQIYRYRYLTIVCHKGMLKYQT